MPSCVFKHCKSCSQKQEKGGSLSFHRLPTDEDLRDDWICIIRESRRDAHWQPSNFCVVCSLHFREEDVYFTEKGRRLVKKTAKPSINLAPAGDVSAREHYMNAVVECQVEITVDDPLDVPVEAADPSQCPIKSEEPELRESDLDSVFDTPIESHLRKKLKRQLSLRARHKQKLKSMQQNIRRLKKRNESLKNMLRDKKFTRFDTNSFKENPVATELFLHLFERSSGKRTVQYSPEFRKFALTLNRISPKAYEFVRRTFNSCLPHPKSLTKQDDDEMSCDEDGVEDACRTVVLIP